jgi:conjugative transfer signal peptidase TraF
VSRWHDRAGRIIALGLAVGGIAGLVAMQFAGYRINRSASMPQGLWRIALTDAVHRGDVVILCVPDTAATRQGAGRAYVGRGTCPNGLEPLLKPVIAVAGDIVSISDGGVGVNGLLLPGTRQLLQDSAGRDLIAMPMGEYLVQPGDVWTVSGYSASSWDSRYWGPVPIVNIQGRAVPVWLLP